METAEQKLHAHDERRVSVEAMVHPRTVRSYLAGKNVRSTSAACIERALVKLGMSHLCRNG
jgi:hypothetical protein